MAKKQNENFYEMLEVDQTATAEEIKRSYYRLSKKYHPDINPKTANIFREINEAYETLRDPISRTLYDAKLKTEDVAYDTNDYYTKASYYKDPKKEPLKSVFEHFTEYRFETAMSAIWGRNIFLLFGNFMMFATVFTTKVTVSFINLFRTNKYTLDNVPDKFIWRWLRDNVDSSKRTLFTYTIFLLTLVLAKTIYHTFKITYWIFKNIIKYFLIPAAIVISAMIRSGSLRSKRTMHF